MSDLKTRNLHRLKTGNLLTTEETSLIIGGTTVTINNSFNDLVDAGDGNDLIFTGPGNDTVIGGSGNDILFGGSGDDLLIGD